MASAAFRDRVAAVCAPLPGAAVNDPCGGGHDAWKVGDKMFACIGGVVEGVSVKCPDIETAAMLITAGVGAPAPYFHRSWVRLPESVDDADLRHRILTSYRLVRAGLPAALRRTLADAPEA